MGPITTHQIKKFQIKRETADKFKIKRKIADKICHPMVDHMVKNANHEVPPMVKFFTSCFSLDFKLEVISHQYPSNQKIQNQEKNSWWEM